jgi:hypothetical protein
MTWVLTMVAVALVMSAALSGPARGQEPAGGALTAALLTEVRGLRSAIEQLASSNARIQLAIGRLQIQEQRVNTLLRQQIEVRQKLVEADRLSAQNEARLADLLDYLGTISDSGERAAMTQEIAQLKQIVAAENSALQKMRADEAEISGLVSSEQGRWNAINQELDSLDRALRQP